MGKQPYIPLYIGDWEQDTNTISLEAEGALIKLVFKLWKAKERGKMIISFNQLSILLKKPQELALKIIKELQENEVLNIEIFSEGIVNIESRRMMKETSKSMAYSENGKKGGRGKKGGKKQIKSQSKAKPKPIPENDIDNDTEGENEIRVLPPPKNFPVVPPFTSDKFKIIWMAWKNYRIESHAKQYNTMGSEQAALDRLSKHPEEIAIGMIKLAMSNNWKDFFEPTQNGKTNTTDRNTKHSAIDAMGAAARGRLEELQRRNDAAGNPE